MDYQTAIVISYAIIILLVALLKTRYFSSSCGRKTIRRWFYFSKYEIINARSVEIEIARQKQNRLTVCMLVLSLLLPVLLFL
jgi:hypothetical protein